MWIMTVFCVSPACPHSLLLLTARNSGPISAVYYLQGGLWSCLDSGHCIRYFKSDYSTLRTDNTSYNMDTVVVSTINPAPNMSGCHWVTYFDLFKLFKFYTTYCDDVGLMGFFNHRQCRATRDRDNTMARFLICIVLLSEMLWDNGATTCRDKRRQKPSLANFR
ncbi:hypothetical protein C8J56DRAFT_881244 [Mycena floridula]|nr:hypothetical protein C8J56DRAFT_881244 [Mycena floridula]